MADVDAITKLLDVGFNAVFLFLLWRVYQDFMKVIERNSAYMEKLVDKLMADDEPHAVRIYPPPPTNPYSSRTPTELGEVRAGGD